MKTQSWAQFFREQWARPGIFILRTLMFLSIGAMLGEIIYLLAKGQP